MLTALLSVASLQLLLFALCVGTEYLDRADLAADRPGRSSPELTPSTEAYELPMAA